MKTGHTVVCNGVTLVISTICGFRYFHCPFPEIAARFDGAGDDEVCAAIEEFIRLARGLSDSQECKQ